MRSQLRGEIVDSSKSLRDAVKKTPHFERLVTSLRETLNLITESLTMVLRASPAKVVSSSVVV